MSGQHAIDVESRDEGEDCSTGNDGARREQNLSHARGCSDAIRRAQGNHVRGDKTTPHTTASDRWQDEKGVQSAGRCSAVGSGEGGGATVCLLSKQRAAAAGGERGTEQNGG